MKFELIGMYHIFTWTSFLTFQVFVEVEFQTVAGGQTGGPYKILLQASG